MTSEVEEMPRLVTPVTGGTEVNGRLRIENLKNHTLSRGTYLYAAI